MKLVRFEYALTNLLGDLTLGHLAQRLVEHLAYWSRKFEVGFGILYGSDLYPSTQRTVSRDELCVMTAVFRKTVQTVPAGSLTLLQKYLQ